MGLSCVNGNVNGEQSPFTVTNTVVNHRDGSLTHFYKEY